MRKKILDIRENIIYIKVGLFFLAALAIFFITIISIKNVSLFKGYYIVKVKFNFSEGLLPASPVRFCGVDVGEIKKVVVRGDSDVRPYVIVFAKIEKGINIPAGSRFFINSLSLFGEKYLEIIPPDKIISYIKEGDIIAGLSPIPLFNVVSDFNKTVNKTRAFLKEGKMKESFEKTINNMEEITSQINGLIKDVKNKQGTIGKLLYDDSLYKETEEFIEDIKTHPWKLLHKPRRKR